MEAANDTDPFQTLNISVIDPIDYLIHIPYAIAGAITIFSAMIVLGLFFYKKYEPPRKFKAPNDDQLSYQSKKKSSILQNGKQTIHIYSNRILTFSLSQMFEWFSLKV